MPKHSRHSSSRKKESRPAVYGDEYDARSYAHLVPGQAPPDAQPTREASSRHSSRDGSHSSRRRKSKKSKHKRSRESRERDRERTPPESAGNKSLVQAYDDISSDSDISDKVLLRETVRSPSPIAPVSRSGHVKSKNKRRSVSPATLIRSYANDRSLSNSPSHARDPSPYSDLNAKRGKQKRKQYSPNYEKQFDDSRPSPEPPRAYADLPKAYSARRVASPSPPRKFTKRYVSRSRSRSPLFNRRRDRAHSPNFNVGNGNKSRNRSRYMSPPNRGRPMSRRSPSRSPTRHSNRYSLSPSPSGESRRNRNSINQSTVKYQSSLLSEISKHKRARALRNDRLQDNKRSYIKDSPVTSSREPIVISPSPPKDSDRIPQQKSHALPERRESRPERPDRIDQRNIDERRPVEERERRPVEDRRTIEEHRPVDERRQPEDRRPGGYNERTDERRGNVRPEAQDESRRTPPRRQLPLPQVVTPESSSSHYSERSRSREREPSPRRRRITELPMPPVVDDPEYDQDPDCSQDLDDKKDPKLKRP
ncbi:hypothetical protein LOTGIDRAFT_172428, partial [Lottia gigantea]